MVKRLKNGDSAPDFQAITDQNKPFRLRDLRGERIILYFYPRDDTSGCTTQACLFRDCFLDLREKNTVILGISPDGISSHQKFKEKHQLPFTLLIDPDHVIAKKYGVWLEKSMYGRKYMGIVRSHFVIDEDGKIVDTQYKISPKNSVKYAYDLVTLLSEKKTQG